MRYYQFADLIWTKQNALPPEFCKHCIRKFEDDPNKHQGKILSGVDTNFKKSMDLSISGRQEWEREDKFFFKSLSDNVKKYTNQYSNEFDFFRSLGNLSDTGYNMQRTKPGDFYNWHNDFLSLNNKYRILTLIWYLNDINHDGETEFIDGTKIKPEQGKLLIFPATWSYTHRGISPKFETKYICTGWVCAGVTEKDGKIFYK